MVTSSIVPAVDRRLDDVLDHSFPASDPPPWTVEGAEADRVQAPEDTSGALEEREEPRRAGFTAALRPVAGLLGAAALCLLVPLMIVLLPLALAYRLVLELTGWPSSRRASHTWA